jgi:hypothetical protein
MGQIILYLLLQAKIPLCRAYREGETMGVPIPASKPDFGAIVRTGVAAAAMAPGDGAGAGAVGWLAGGG